MDLLDKVIKTCESRDLLEPGDAVVIGLSGGPDSVALLDLLFRMRQEWQLSLYVVHLNHMFRGAQAEEDFQFCRELAAKLGLPFFGYRIDVTEYSRSRGLNSQHGGRLLRYLLFSEVAKEVGGAKVAVAHHRNDVVETFFMRLLRGGGLKGLSSIPPKRGNVIRPLYDVTKPEVEAYCDQRGLEWRLDPSNNSEKYWRNRIRLRLLPFLEKFSADLVESTSRLVEIVRSENEFLEELTQAAWDQLVQREKDWQSRGKYVFAWDEFTAQPLALQRRLVQMAYLKMGVSDYQLSFAHVEQVLDLVKNQGGQQDLPKGVRVQVSKDRVGFFLSEPGKPTGSTPAKASALPRRQLTFGENSLPEWGLEITLKQCQNWPTPEELRDALAQQRDTWHRGGNWEIWLDAAKVALPLSCRQRLKGDRFRPLGMSGSKKLKDYLIDRKIPREKRDLIPLLCDQQGIVAVVGHQQAEDTKITDNTTIALRVTFRQTRQSPLEA
ncbi:MAG: tRNA lysidine(34) synthetase TilS [Firmicutes bacterium]|nr:tRNA lysidine(34) synthetase TilS [Bacillota bacterium]